MKGKIKGLFLILLFLIASNFVYSDDNSRIVSLNDKKQAKNSDYSSVICFHIKSIENLDVMNTVSQKMFTLRYNNGKEFFKELLRVKGHIENGAFYTRDLLCFSVKPGFYDMISLKTSLRSAILTIPLNRSVIVPPGKICYLGEFSVGLNYRTDYANNDSLQNETQASLKEEYPKISEMYKDDFVAINWKRSEPVQMKTVFIDNFKKSTGLWQEIDDETHHAYYKDDQFYLESKLENNVATQWITLPEEFGDTFKVDLKSASLSAGKNAYGLLLSTNKSHRYSYVFGISNNGMAAIWFWVKSNSVLQIEKDSHGLVPWKVIPSFAKDGTSVNSLCVQVIKRSIAFYVNDMLVAREPYNKYSGNGSEFPYGDHRTVGIFSYGKQVVRFDEIKFSKPK